MQWPVIIWLIVCAIPPLDALGALICVLIKYNVPSPQRPEEQQPADDNGEGGQFDPFLPRNRKDADPNANDRQADCDPMKCFLWPWNCVRRYWPKNAIEFWSVALAFATFALFLVAYWQYRLTEAVERPWVGVIQAVLRPLVDNDHVGVGVLIQNGGHSPANYVLSVYMEFNPKNSPADNKARENCEGKPLHEKSGFVLLPGVPYLSRKTSDPPVDPKTITYFRQLLKSPVPSPMPTAPPDSVFDLRGCFDYAGGDDQWYRTRFNYELDPRAGQTDPNYWLHPSNEGNSTSSDP